MTLMRVFFGLLVWFAATAWLRPLALPDEGRYVGVAWEMVRSGNWLVPTLDTLPYFHKPPLFYWLTASGLSVFGLNEWAARLAPLLAATVGSFAVYVFGRKWISEGAGQVALLVMATLPFVYGASQYANLDLVVAVAITATILLAADAVLPRTGAHDGADDKQGSGWSLIGAYGAAGMGVLAKGLIGALVPGVVIVVWLVVIGRARDILQLISIAGLFLFAGIAVPWFWLMQQRFPEFLDYFFIHHHVARFAATGFNNQLPFWFFVAVFPLLTLPWSAALLPVYRPLEGRRAMRADVWWLLWIWIGVVVGFFSIPSSKIVGYMLPAVPPVALLVGQRLCDFSVRAEVRAAVVRTVVISVAILAGLLIGVTVWERNNEGRVLSQLAGEIKSDDIVIALGDYPFSAAFYLRLTQPVGVVEKWDDTAHIQRKDTWRKELAEAAAFDVESGKRVLLRALDERVMRCADKPVWVIGNKGDAARVPALEGFEPVVRSRNVVVWRGGRGAQATSANGALFECAAG